MAVEAISAEKSFFEDTSDVVFDLQRLDKATSHAEIASLQKEWLTLYQKKIILSLNVLGRDTSWFLRKRTSSTTPIEGVPIDVLREYLDGFIVESENWEQELRICTAILESEKSKSDEWASNRVVQSEQEIYARTPKRSK